MYCQKCGAQNDDNAYKCVQCGEVIPHAEAAPAAPPREISNHLAQSILVTLFCCVPLGIPAIVFSAQVNSKLAAGDVDGAMESSRKAKLWANWAFGVGIVVGILYVILTVLAKQVGK